MSCEELDQTKRGVKRGRVVKKREEANLFEDSVSGDAVAVAHVEHLVDPAVGEEGRVRVDGERVAPVVPARGEHNSHGNDYQLCTTANVRTRTTAERVVRSLARVAFSFSSARRGEARRVASRLAQREQVSQEITSHD